MGLVSVLVSDVFIYLSLFIVSLLQVRIIWEEATPAEKTPSTNWPAVESVGIFLINDLMWEG